MKTLIAATCISMALLTVHAQEMPADYQGVLKTLDKKGDHKSGVLKINIPRNDLKVTIDGAATPTPFGFGGWLAMTKGDGGSDVIDRKSTRLNSSHLVISYAVFCLKKKT